MMNLFLEHLSQEFADYFIVMQVDQAGWHRSGELVVPVIAKDLCPLSERQVRGESYAGSLVAITKELEEQLSRWLGEGQIA